MNSRGSFRIAGGLSAVVAALGLWIAGVRPFADKTPVVPVEIRVRNGDGQGPGEARLWIRNTGDQTLRQVEILGYGKRGDVRVQRKDNWPPGEELNLGSKASWISTDGTDIEISAAGYRVKKQQM